MGRAAEGRGQAALPAPHRPGPRPPGPGGGRSPLLPSAARPELRARTRARCGGPAAHPSLTPREASVETVEEAPGSREGGGGGEGGDGGEGLSGSRSGGAQGSSRKCGQSPEASAGPGAWRRRGGLSGNHDDFNGDAIVQNYTDVSI